MRTICFISHKGGVGKTTLAACLAAAGQEMGLRAGVLDLDFPTLGLTRMAKLRADQGLAAPLVLPTPMMPSARTPGSKEAGALVGAAVSQAKALGIELFLIDMEAVTNALWLKAAACLVSDRVVTPIGDSPLDIEAILPAEGEGDLAQFIRSAGSRRPDWLVVRNRTGHLRTNLGDALQERLIGGATAGGYRLIQGLKDRVAYRQMFDSGRTPLDAPQGQLGLSMSQISARGELRRLAAELLDDATLRFQAQEWRSDYAWASGD